MLQKQKQGAVFDFHQIDEEKSTAETTLTSAPTIIFLLGDTRGERRLPIGAC